MKSLDDETWLFNEIAGSNKELTLQAFRNQLKFIQEEVKEIEEGLDKQDITEVLDGVVDTLVTAYGMLSKLAALGIDTEEAKQRISDNNLSKYPEYSKDIVEKTFDLYKNKGVDIRVETCYCEGFGKVLAVFRRNDNNKIVKPYGFEAVDLSDLTAGIDFAKE